MKHLNYIAALLFATTTVTSQEIKLKKEIVYVGELPTFSFLKKAMGNEMYLYKLNTQDELVHMLVDNNNTEIKQDDGKKIIFTQQKTTIQSKNFRSRTWDFLIDLLVQEKVIDLKGTINVDNLNRFKAKYDDNDIYKTMR